MTGRGWAVAGLAVLAAAAGRWATAELSPPVWIDEVMIVDFGRYTAAGPAGRAWSVNVLPDGTARMVPAPVLVLAQAGLFRLVPPSLDGWRWATWAGGPLLGLAAAAVLRRLGLPAAVAVGVPLALVFDRVIVQSAWGGRVDSYALALLLAGLATLLPRDGRPAGGWRAAVGGGLIGAAGGVWATVVIAAAGLAVAWLILTADSVRRVVGAAVPAAVGATLVLAAAGAAMVPLGVWGELVASHSPQAIDATYRPRWQALEATAEPALSPRAMARVLAEVARLDPAVPVLLVGGLLFATGRAGWAFRAAVAVSVVLAVVLPPIYLYRAIYAIPAVYLLAAVALARLPARPRLAAVAVLVLANFGLSVAGRTAVALRERDGRDYQAYERELAAVIPDGAVVWDTTYTVYYAGLARGWRVYGERLPEAAVASGRPVFCLMPASEPLPPGFEPAAVTAARTPPNYTVRVGRRSAAPASKEQP